MKLTHRLNSFTFVASICSALGVGIALSQSHHDHDHSAPPPPAERHVSVNAEELAKRLTDEKLAQAPTPALQLPPLPEGVTDLQFREFFQNPVGPQGLEPSAKLLSLNGKRVRILGYVAEIECPSKRDIIFAPMPLKPQPEEYGDADEIPATHVRVTIPGNPEEQVAFVPGPLLLTGTLSVGTPAEHRGNSFVRLLLDAAPATQAPAAQPASH